jgi:hypothetical protein
MTKQFMAFIKISCYFMYSYKIISNYSSSIRLVSISFAIFRNIGMQYSSTVHGMLLEKLAFVYWKYDLYSSNFDYILPIHNFFTLSLHYTWLAFAICVLSVHAVRAVTRRNNWGGGIFIYSRSARWISFESNCLIYGMWTWLYEYWPHQLSCLVTALCTVYLLNY